MEKPRLLFIDNLRILLITLVAMVHLSITYGGAGSWYYKEGQSHTLTSVLLSWHNGTIQAFSMGLFFLIAGYFTPGSYDRKGPRQFLKDRLLRLGIPMLCYDFVIGPLVAYPLIQTGALKTAGTYGDYLKWYYSRFHIGTGPLWFVEALLIFAIGYTLWRVFLGRTATADQTGRSFPESRAIVAFAVALGAASFIVRIWLPISWAFEPLNLQFPFFPQYICLFIVGIVACRRNWLLRIPNAAGRFWLLVAILFVLIVLPALLVAGGALSGDPTPSMGGPRWQCFAYALWEQVAGAAIIIALLVLFSERLNHQGRLARAASASAYTAYIVHGPVVILVALAIRNVALHPLLKFALAVLISVPLCFAVSNVIRKLPLARRIL